MTDQVEPPPETVEQYKLRLEQARIAHENHQASIKLLTDPVFSFGAAAMRAPGLAAAGGVAAALGFYSANFATLKNIPDAIHSFNNALYWLFVSLLLTVAAPGIAYFSQSFFSNARSAETRDWQHPYIFETPKSRLYQRLGLGFQIMTILDVILSILALLLGGLKLLNLVANINSMMI